MVRLDLSLDDVRNCGETTAFVKKGVFNFAYTKKNLFEKSKEPGKFRASKTRKMLEK